MRAAFVAFSVTHRFSSLQCHVSPFITNSITTNPSNRYVFVVLFLCALQSPTKWYMKLVPVSHVMCAMLFNLYTHSGLKLSPLHLSVIIVIILSCSCHPLTSLLCKRILFLTCNLRLQTLEYCSITNYGGPEML